VVVQPDVDSNIDCVKFNKPEKRKGRPDKNIDIVQTRKIIITASCMFKKS
jgi:hypothetical protein